MEEKFQKRKKVIRVSNKQALRLLTSYINMPKFPACNVPVAFVAKVMKKDATFIRAGIEQGWLPIGYAKPSAKTGKMSYYISPKFLWEVTGILYEPEKEGCDE